MIATGARSFVPAIHGIDAVPFHTSDTILHIARLPEHLVVLGGGFIAAELSHVFGSLGSQVTIVNRGHRLLRAEDHDISERYTQIAARRFDVVLGARVRRVYMTARGNRHARRERRWRAHHRGRHPARRRRPTAER